MNIQHVQSQKLTQIFTSFSSLLTYYKSITDYKKLNTKGKITKAICSCYPPKQTQIYYTKEGF
jgi:hypothetical protein